MPRRIETETAIRDAAIKILRSDGVVTCTEKLGLQMRWSAPEEAGFDLEMSLRAPIEKIALLSPHFRKQCTALNSPFISRGRLPCGLNIWTSKKVLNIEWDDKTGRVDLVSFRRGDWEDTVLSWR